MRVAHWRAMLRCVQPRATQRLAPRKWGLRASAVAAGPLLGGEPILFHLLN